VIPLALVSGRMILCSEITASPTEHMTGTLLRYSRAGPAYAAAAEPAQYSFCRAILELYCYLTDSLGGADLRFRWNIFFEPWRPLDHSPPSNPRD
jgi:hypothetical protein